MPWKESAGRGVKLTYDDYVLFPEDGNMHELIDGVHHVTPPSNTRHVAARAGLSRVAHSDPSARVTTTSRSSSRPVTRIRQGLQHTSQS